jgi:hypothetical protein
LLFAALSAEVSESNAGRLTAQKNTGDAMNAGMFSMSRLGRPTRLATSPVDSHIPGFYPQQFHRMPRNCAITSNPTADGPFVHPQKLRRRALASEFSTKFGEWFISFFH